MSIVLLSTVIYMCDRDVDFASFYGHILCVIGMSILLLSTVIYMCDRDVDCASFYAFPFVF